MKKRARKTPRRTSRKDLKPWKKLGLGGKVWRALWVALLIFFVFSFCQVLLFKFVNPAYTPLMAIRHFEQKKDPSRQERCARQWVSLDDVAPVMQNTLIASEGGGVFLYNRGFVFDYLRKAYLINEHHRRGYLVGGSSISQQTAKNCFLYPGKSWLRKGLETYYTILIEALWGKKRIMECYLNVIEFADGIYGVEAASQYYFGHPASMLTKEEARQLASALPCPIAGNPNHPNGVYDWMYNNIGRFDITNAPVNWDAKRSDLAPADRAEAKKGLVFFFKWMVLHEWRQHFADNKS